MAAKLTTNGKPGKNDIFRSLEAEPVSVEDTTVMAHNFEYVPRIISGPGIEIDFEKSMYPGCECKEQCSENTCSCIVKYGPNYDKGGHLLKAENKAGYCLPIFECNSNCLCSAFCMNRLSQQGINIKLQITQTKSKGLGVRSLQSIAKHQFICEYSGEIISYDEAKRRTAQIGKEHRNYIFVLKEHIAKGKILRTHIDATNYGNVARFMNHSCDPNMDLFPVRINSPVPRLCLFASRDIGPAEELTFSYGFTAFEETDDTPYDQNTNCNFLEQRTRCLCGSSNCTGYLPFNEHLYVT